MQLLKRREFGVGAEGKGPCPSFDRDGSVYRLARGVLYDVLGVDMDLWDGTLEPLAYTTTTTTTSITILYKCYRLK